MSALRSWLRRWDFRQSIEAGEARAPHEASEPGDPPRARPADTEPRAPSADAEPQAPSPWAIAVAVLALLGFGVVVGSTVSPAQQSGASAPLLAASRGGTPGTSSTSSASTPPPLPTAGEATPTPSGASPFGEEAGEEPAQEKEGGAKSKKGAKAGAQSKTNGSESSGAKQGNGGGGSKPSSTGLPPIKHVFLIVLSDEGYAASFGAGSSATYLAQTLPKEGELLDNYYAVAGGELANGIALISGQGPTPQTAADCPLYSDFAPGTIGAEGQALGSGCVYPKKALTLADQLASAGRTWRAYVEGVDAGGTGTASTCRHPAIGTSDARSAPSQSDPYVTWRNPFVYFHSLIDGTTCAQDDVGLGALAGDLTSASTTPTLAYIAPDPCDDGAQAPCSLGAPAGLAPAEAFLRKVVGEIETSPAYKEGGLIAITFDQAPQTGAGADSSGCCVTSPYPNLPAGSASAGTGTASTTTSATTTVAPTTVATPGTTPPAPTGGGKIGLLLISKYVKPGSLNVLGEYDHFSLLLSIEQLFGLQPLGYAGAKGLLPFDSSVYNAYKQR